METGKGLGVAKVPGRSYGPEHHVSNYLEEDSVNESIFLANNIGDCEIKLF